MFSTLTWGDFRGLGSGDRICDTPPSRIGESWKEGKGDDACTERGLLLTSTAGGADRRRIALLPAGLLLFSLSLSLATSLHTHFVILRYKTNLTVAFSEEHQ